MESLHQLSMSGTVTANAMVESTPKQDLSHMPTQREASTSSAATLQAEPLPKLDSRALPEVSPKKRLTNSLLFNRDHRKRLPVYLSRFIGYHPSASSSPKAPLPFPPFSWLKKIPLRFESWLFATIGSFVGILLIEATMSTTTAFRDAYHSPLIIASFGASAVLIYGVPEAPLAQPRNVILGQFLSALIATAITRLWIITNPDYVAHLENKEFYAPVFINGALCMALALLGQLVCGVVHPPGGATALAAATDPAIVAMIWTYLPAVLVSAIIMVAWALIVNNVGRRRYPVYWWKAGQNFVKEAEEQIKDIEEQLHGHDSNQAIDLEALGEDLAMTRARTSSTWH